MLLVHKRDRDGLLRAVRGGLDAEVLEPRIRARAEAVHGAVQMHGGDGLMHIQDALHQRHVLHAGGALVMDDDVVALGPVRIVIERQRRHDGLVIRPHHIHLHIRPCLDALAQDHMLLGIIMTAAPGDEEGF